MRNRDFLRSVFVVVLGAGLIGFGLGFIRYFENWVWFPVWPNIGDSAFIIVAGLVLLYFGVPRRRS